MTRTKLASILTFLALRLKEPTTRSALTGLLALVGAAALGAHLDTITALVGLTALVVAVPEAGGTPKEDV